MSQVPKAAASQSMTLTIALGTLEATNGENDDPEERESAYEMGYEPGGTSDPEQTLADERLHRLLPISGGSEGGSSSSSSASFPRALNARMALARIRMKLCACLSEIVIGF